jgi:hypothetical protein
MRGGAEGKAPLSEISPSEISALFIYSFRVRAEAWGACCLLPLWQEAERAYQLWKARQVADQQGSGAVAVKRGRGGEEGEAVLDFAVKRLKGDLFSDLIEYMG